MNTFFEVRAKYEKMDSNGRERMVSEPYLIDAVSFTDAEKKIHEELEKYIVGEFFVCTVKIAKYSEVLANIDGDKWFKCKVSFISIDEEKGIEKRSNTYILVRANNVPLAYDLLNETLSDSVSDFEIPTVQETPIIDVFTYTESETESTGVLYCIEVDRSGLPEENMVIHHTFNKEPTREEVKQVVIDEDCGYNDTYCKFEYYRVD